MSSWLLTTAYIGGMLAVMSTFSWFWRRRKNAHLRCEPWFSENKEKAVYIALLQQTDPKATDVQLISALLRRAMADIQRLMKLERDKRALAGLVQRGAIGDDLWAALLEAELELNHEAMEVMNEASTFFENWGRYIFQNAREMVNHQQLKDIREEMKELKEKEEKAAKRREERERIETEEFERREKARLEKERKKAQEELLKDESQKKNKGKSKKK